MRQGETIPGWNIDNATVDLTGTYFDAYEGDFSVDMVGTPGYGTISQVVATIPGVHPRYQLSGRELLVRARVTSSLAHDDPSFPDQRQQAWTQPIKPAKK